MSLNPAQAKIVDDCTDAVRIAKTNGHARRVKIFNDYIVKFNRTDILHEGDKQTFVYVCMRPVTILSRALPGLCAGKGVGELAGDGSGCRDTLENVGATTGMDEDHIGTFCDGADHHSAAEFIFLLPVIILLLCHLSLRTSARRVTIYFYIFSKIARSRRAARAPGVRSRSERLKLECLIDVES